jgi:tellurite methyltransferase
MTDRVPSGATLVRVAGEFDEASTPRALRRAHRIADGVWGVREVRAGGLGFVFEDDGEVHDLGAGDRLVIPPGRSHHVDIDGPVRFVVEFHRDTVTA